MSSPPRAVKGQLFLLAGGSRGQPWMSLGKVHHFTGSWEVSTVLINHVSCLRLRIRCVGQLEERIKRGVSQHVVSDMFFCEKYPPDLRFCIQSVDSTLHPSTWNTLFQAVWAYLPQPVLDYVRFIPTREYSRFLQSLKVVNKVSKTLIKQKSDMLLHGDKTSKDVMSVLGKTCSQV